VVSVVEAVKRDLGVLAKRDASLARSALAASCLVLAAQLDDPGNSATSKSMCARALREAMDRLRELAPPESVEDRLDDLGARRAKRLAGRAAAARRKRS
jgi:hypothetical protein